jgi:hypothetical protein
MAVDDTERERRRRLVQAHMDAENEHDLEAIIGTFSGDGEMVFNTMTFKGPEALRQSHTLFGMSAGPGALSGTRVVPEREHFTDDEIVIEGRVTGKHVGDLLGFPATNREVALPYVAVYHFDQAGKLVSERIVMDFSAFAGAPAPQPEQGRAQPGSPI